MQVRSFESYMPLNHFLYLADFEKKHIALGLSVCLCARPLIKGFDSLISYGSFMQTK